MPAVVPHVLMGFPNRQLEQVWQAGFHAMFYNRDLWWSVGLILWGISVVRQWQGGPGVEGTLWFIAHTTGPLLVLWLRAGDRRIYLRHRSSLLTCVRLAEAVLVSVVLGKYQNAIYALPEPVQDPFALVTAHTVRYLYVLSQHFAYVLPVRYQLWLVTASTLAAVSTLPRRCQLECSDVAGYGVEASLLAHQFGWMRKLWVFSPNAGAEAPLLPWQSCCLVHAYLQVIIAAIMPLVAQANIEEVWRLRWMAGRGGQPFHHTSNSYLAYAGLGLPLMALIAYETCLLWVRVLPWPAVNS